MSNVYKKIYLAILFIGVLISLTLGYYTYNNNLEKKQIQFNSLTKNLIEQIKNRMATYKEILYSGTGFFEASEEVTREEWHIFINKLQLSEFFPGIQGIGYSKVLKENELEKNIQDVRAEGFPSYKIYPEGKRDLYTTIMYIEPFDQRNQRAFGYDMFSEENRRNAMSRSIETGLPTLSNKVRLVQENGKDEQSGFLLYTPLYKKGFPLETKEQRYIAIQGFVYAVFRTKNFINGAIGDSLKLINIKMYDGSEKNKDELLFDSNSEINKNYTFNKSIEVELDGHLWTFEITTKDSFLELEENIYSIVFTFFGFAITFLLALLVKRQGQIELLKDDALLNVSQGIMVTNSNREIIYTNKAFEELTGYKQEAIYGQEAKFLQGKDTDLESIKFIKENLKKSKPFECEILNYKKDGSSFWNRLSITPIFDSNNNLKRYIGIQNDITEKKILEKEMLFEKKLIENILDNTSAIIALIDMNGVMVKLNEYGRNLVGYTQKEISQEAYFWKKFVPTVKRQNVIEIIEDAKNGILIEKRQNAWISKNGEEKIFEWSNQLIKDVNGKPEYIITVGIDVTKDVLAQEEYKKYQKQLELSAQISGLAFWELNLRTNIFTLNDFCYTFLGTSVEKEGGYEVDLETYLNAFVPQENQKIIMETIHSISTKSKDYQDNFEYEMRKKDGTILQVLINLYISYDEYGKPFKAYGTKYNLTKQKEKEQLLIDAKEKAENASKAKTEFLANMSHEIRTPLNGIIGITNLLLETHLNEAQKSYLNKLIISSEALLHVINDILDYSKIEVNKIKLEHIPFELDKMLQQISNLFIYEAQKKGIELDCNIDPLIQNNLIGDPFRINQILINLVGNALKFTNSGFVHIHVKLDNIKSNTMKLNFQIKDTGIGISNEKQDKLFKKFSQVDTSNTREYGGSGLGLVISQKLARLMDGEVFVESTEGVGSTFSFTSIVEYEKKDYKFLSQDLKNKKALIINDKVEMRNDINKTLEVFSLKTEICNDIKSAQELLEEQDFDYIIVESELAGQDVIEFVKEIDFKYSNKNIKTIIIASLNNKENIINKAQISGISINRILIKPFSSSTLLDILVNNSDVKLEENENIEKINLKGKVLLVEDNEINQLVAKQNLENFGLEVFTADNGKIAIEEVKNKNFDMIFMDLQMPVMDGFESSKRIREFAPTIPIIALSAAVMDEDLQMTQEAGMNEHLAKPIDIKELKQILKKYIKTTNNQFLSPEKETIIEEFIDGVNLKELINRLNNNKKLAFEMLETFAKSKENIVDDINSIDVESEEFKSLIHTIKGVSANLALIDVYEYSNEIYSCKDRNEKEKLLPKLKDSLTDVLKEINKKVTSKTFDKKETCTYSKIDILNEIKRLNKDMSQGIFITQDKKDLIINQIKQISDEDTALELEQYLSEFDYEKTKNLLDKIIGVED